MAKPPVEIVDVATVEVALKLPKVGVDVAVITPEAFVESRESIGTPESVRPESVGLAVVFTLWSNQSSSVGAPFTVRRLPLTVRFDVRRFVLEAVVEKKSVVVAEVPVALSKVKLVNVEDAVEIRPLVKTIVVEVETSPVESAVKGNGLGQALSQSPSIQRLLKLPVVEKKLVVVAEVPVAVVNCNVWTVVEALAKSPPVTVMRSLDASPRKVWS
jgi:hypothetical protein